LASDHNEKFEAFWRKQRMNRTRVVATLLFVILGLTVFALGRVASPQAVLEETISGPIATTRTITQNARLTGNVTCTVDSAPCIQFGAPGLTLNLNGFAITGQADPATGCQGARFGNAAGTFNEEGIGAFDQADETIQGPGLIQRFRGDGIMLFNSTRSLVTQVTASTNCQSGILVFNSSDNHIESNVSVRNGASVFPCGGI
jgi:hypothetical protein